MGAELREEYAVHGVFQMRRETVAPAMREVLPRRKRNPVFEILRRHGQKVVA